MIASKCPRLKVSVPSSTRLKCPLRSTNKRFLLNTLRSTGLQQHTAESRDGNSTARGRLRSDSPDRSRNRSRTPPRDPRGKGDQADRKHRREDSCNNKDKKPERDKESSCRHADSRDGRHGKDGRDRAKGGLHEWRLLFREGNTDFTDCRSLYRPHLGGRSCGPHLTSRPRE